jgi:hypothetical protein
MPQIRSKMAADKSRKSDQRWRLLNSADPIQDGGGCVPIHYLVDNVKALRAVEVEHTVEGGGVAVKVELVVLTKVFKKATITTVFQQLEKRIVKHE